jgi:hypothetical protein
MSERKRAPRRRSSGEGEEGSASASPPQQGPRPNYPSPPQHMGYSGQPGPQQGAYMSYQHGRPSQVSSMHPNEAGSQQQFPPGAGAPPFGGLPPRPGDLRAAASAQQVTPDTRQLLHNDFMSPHSAVRRRSPSPPGTKETASKRPRVARSGTLMCLCIYFVR